MKKIFLISLVCLLSAVLFCQPADNQKEVLLVDVSDINEDGVLNFDNQKGSILVTGYAGDKILVTAEPRYSEARESANSAQSLNRYPFSISAEIRGNEVLLLCESNGKTIDFDIKIPASFAVKLKSGDNGKIRIYNINSDVEVENPYGDIILAGISGSASLNTIEGNIIADFKRIDQIKPLMLTSLDGDIELSIPEDSKIDFKLKSSQGEINSELNIERQSRSTVVRQTNDKKVVTFDDWTYCKMNGGGSECTISTYGGEISIKKR